MMDDLISRRAAIECLKTKIAEMFFKETAITTASEKG